MPIALALGTGLAGVTTTIVMARRECRARRVRRARLFDDCRSLFETSRITVGLDGFPRLEGSLAGRPVRIDAVPDSLTLKRLPQLWLQVTRPMALPIAGDFALLARPTGSEFYALTHRMTRRLETPAGLPPALLARGTGPQSQVLLDRLIDPLSAVFADPRVKELAVTRRGCRVVTQAAQGKRGEYLLLRQSVFEGLISRATTQASLESLAAIEDALLSVGTASPPVVESVPV